MSTAHALPEVTFEEFLAAEAGSEQRCEWVAGHVYAISGGSERHDLMAGLVYEALAPAARARGCRPFVQNRKVRLDQAAYYPDVVVVCPGGPPPDRLFERDLSVVVEVLSPSTERTDRQEKAVAYAGAASFSAYVVVDPDRRWIEVGTPAPGGGLRWRVVDTGPVPGVDLDADALYDALDRTAVT